MMTEQVVVAFGVIMGVMGFIIGGLLVGLLMRMKEENMVVELLERYDGRKIKVSY